MILSCTGDVTLRATPGSHYAEWNVDTLLTMECPGVDDQSTAESIGFIIKKRIVVAEAWR